MEGFTPLRVNPDLIGITCEARLRRGPHIITNDEVEGFILEFLRGVALKVLALGCEAYCENFSAEEEAKSSKYLDLTRERACFCPRRTFSFCVSM